VGEGRRLVVRLALGAIAAVAVVVGVWAAFFPRSFYDGFPGFGRVWVAADGPFNEHLVRDVGQLILALAVVTVVAVVVPVAPLVRAVGAAWLVQGLPHLVYHASHLELYDTIDGVLNLVSLTVLVVLAVIALLGPQDRPVDATT
jgi:uncharacterized membrane protein HdeD (DUF308 family)